MINRFALRKLDDNVSTESFEEVYKNLMISSTGMNQVRYRPRTGEGRTLKLI